MVKHIPNGFQEITRINKGKWKSFFDMLTKLEKQKNQLNGMQKQLTTNENDKFSNLEFFKDTYFEEKLDKAKMKRIFLNKIKAAEDLCVLQETKRKEGASGEETLKRAKCVEISPDEKKMKSKRNTLSITDDAMSMRYQSNMYDSLLAGSPGAEETSMINA